jgi:hypothetical protein
MAKSERIYRELLLKSLSGRSTVKQKYLAERCRVSIGLVNKVVRKLEEARSVEATRHGVRILSPSRVLNLWATERKLQREIWRSFRLDPISEVERRLPREVIVTAFSAWASIAKRRPAEYHHLHLYVYEKEPFERWLSYRRGKVRKANPNVFVLCNDDEHLRSASSGGVAPVPQIYVDIYSIGGPEASLYLRDIARAHPELGMW